MSSVARCATPCAKHQTQFDEVTHIIMRESVSNAGASVLMTELSCRIDAIRAFMLARETYLRGEVALRTTDGRFPDFEDLMLIWKGMDADLSRCQMKAAQIDLELYLDMAAPRNIARIVDRAVDRVVHCMETTIYALRCVQCALLGDDAHQDIDDKCSAFVAHLRMTECAIDSSVAEYAAGRTDPEAQPSVFLSTSFE